MLSHWIFSGLKKELHDNHNHVTVDYVVMAIIIIASQSWSLFVHPVRNTNSTEWEYTDRSLSTYKSRSNEMAKAVSKEIIHGLVNISSSLNTGLYSVRTIILIVFISHNVWKDNNRIMHGFKFLSHFDVWTHDVDVRLIAHDLYFE